MFVRKGYVLGPIEMVYSENEDGRLTLNIALGDRMEGAQDADLDIEDAEFFIRVLREYVSKAKKIDGLLSGLRS